MKQHSAWIGFFESLDAAAHRSTDIVYQPELSQEESGLVIFFSTCIHGNSIEIIANPVSSRMTRVL